MPNRAGIVVVGAGPGGCASAVQCRRLGATVRLIDQCGRAGGLIANAYRVENYPGLDPAPGPEIADRLAAHLTCFDVAVERGLIERIERKGEGFVLHGTGTGIPAAAVILATGTEPLRLDVPGELALAGEHLFYEPRELLARRSQLSRVLVIGGGEAAYDYALTMAATGVSVTLVVRGNAPRAAARLVQMVDEASGIETLLGTRPTGVTPGVPGVVLQTTRGALGTEAILVAIGRRPVMPHLPEGFTLAAEPRVSTPMAGLFLVGDVRTGSLGQMGIAVGDGLRAAAGAVARNRSIE